MYKIELIPCQTVSAWEAPLPLLPTEPGPCGLRTWLPEQSAPCGTTGHVVPPAQLCFPHEASCSLQGTHISSLDGHDFAVMTKLLVPSAACGRAGHAVPPAQLCSPREASCSLQVIPSLDGQDFAYAVMTNLLVQSEPFGRANHCSASNLTLFTT